MTRPIVEIGDGKRMKVLNINGTKKSITELANSLIASTAIEGNAGTTHIEFEDKGPVYGFEKIEVVMVENLETEIDEREKEYFECTNKNIWPFVVMAILAVLTALGMFGLGIWKLAELLRGLA